MKKMNLNFFGLGAKIVLPLFMLFGLMVISSNTLSAQSYLPTEQAKTVLKDHVDSLGPEIHVFAAKGQELSAEQAEAQLKVLRINYGKYILHLIIKDGKNTKDALQSAYDASLGRIPDNALELVDQEYKDLLTD